MIWLSLFFLKEYMVIGFHEYVLLLVFMKFNFVLFFDSYKNNKMNILASVLGKFQCMVGCTTEISITLFSHSFIKKKMNKKISKLEYFGLISEFSGFSDKSTISNGSPGPAVRVYFTYIFIYF